MKKIILLLAGMFTCALTYSQGTQIAGSPIYYLNSNVGIGTTDPSELFQIYKNTGGIDFTTSLTANELRFDRSDNNPSYFSKIDNGSFIFRTGSSYTNRMTLTNDGKLGLGTHTPGEWLSVVGQDVSFYSNTTTNTLSLGRNINEALKIEVQDTHAFIDLIQDSDNNSNHIMHFRNLADGTSANNDIRFSTGNHARLSIKTNGDVGIGTSTPASKVHIRNGSSAGAPHAYSQLTVEHSDNAMVAILTPSDKTAYYGFADATDNYVGGLQYSHVNNQMGFRVNDKATPSMVINSNENVGIGTTSPSEKLQVEGNILTNGEIYSSRVRVSQNPGNWPDYVFESDYNLTSLEEVERFIISNKHLPEVPSAKSVEKDGLDLGNMDATLLKKIEELTLHLIELNKTVKAQGKEIEQLKTENKALKKARD